MVFDPGLPGTQWDPSDPAAWYCVDCGTQEEPTPEELIVIYTESEC